MDIMSIHDGEQSPTNLKNENISLFATGALKLPPVEMVNTVTKGPVFTTHAFTTFNAGSDFSKFLAALKRSDSNLISNLYSLVYDENAGGDSKESELFGAFAVFIAIARRDEIILKHVYSEKRLPLIIRGNSGGLVTSYPLDSVLKFSTGGSTANIAIQVTRVYHRETHSPDHPKYPKACANRFRALIAKAENLIRGMKTVYLENKDFNGPLHHGVFVVLCQSSLTAKMVCEVLGDFSQFPDQIRFLVMALDQPDPCPKTGKFSWVFGGNSA